MPFKIYTYEDPYKLDKADFWSEISALPHFCSARTLHFLFFRFLRMWSAQCTSRISTRPTLSRSG